MEVTAASFAVADDLSWSWLELGVVAGWLSLPATCLLLCGRCIWLTCRPPRPVKKECMRAETGVQTEDWQTTEGDKEKTTEGDKDTFSTPSRRRCVLESPMRTRKAKAVTAADMAARAMPVMHDLHRAQLCTGPPTPMWMREEAHAKGSWTSGGWRLQMDNVGFSGGQREWLSLGPGLNRIYVSSWSGGNNREAFNRQWHLRRWCSLRESRSRRWNRRTTCQKIKSRGSMKRALSLASSNGEMEKAMDLLKEGFWAASTARARSTKRKEIMELTQRVCGEQEACLPLTRATIEKVAAAMKAGGMKAGDQYLNELKLWHIEEGHPVPPWMIRTIGLCTKSLTRDRGPTKRAKEFQVADLDDDRWTSRPQQGDLCTAPAQAYAWACVWMLRCAELCECRWEHVKVDMEKSEVRLFLPKSKMDQVASGVSRTLRCCGKETCERFCAYGVVNYLRVRRGFDAECKGPMWMSEAGSPIKMTEMISSWRWLWGPQISGHSGRRSGAMAYVRLGMPIQELAFLGRWKSAVVLTYAEEALQTHPANCRLSEPSHKVRAARPKAKAKTVTEQPTSTLVKLEQKAVMWVAANGYKAKERVWHRVSAAGWNMPMNKWTTACGWCFTERSANVSLAYNLPFSTKKCKKCGEARKACDKVKECVDLAGLMSQDLTRSLSSQPIQLDWCHLKKGLCAKWRVGGHEGQVEGSNDVWEENIVLWQTTNESLSTLVWVEGWEPLGSMEVFWFPTHPHLVSKIRN